MKILSARFIKSSSVCFIALGTLITGAAFSSNANASYIPNEKALIKVCKAIQSNSPTRLRTAVKNSGYSYRALGDGLVCNGQNMLEFARSNGAMDTAQIIARRTHTKLPSLIAQNKK